MLPEEQKMFRLSAAESFLSAGIPLQKVDHLRDLLETNGFRLTTSSALSELILTNGPDDGLIYLCQSQVLEITIAATTQSSLMAAHGVERPLQSLCVLSMINGRSFNALCG